MNKRTIVLLLCGILFSTFFTIGISTEVIAQEEDPLPPELIYFDFTPTTIDVSSSDQNVLFTFRITDDLSGFYSCSFGMISPSGEQGRTGTVWLSHRISGDEFDGTYEYTLTFPQLSEGGTWYVNYVSIHDVVGNRLDLDANDLNTMGFISELFITGGEDLAPPILALLDFNPKTVDVSTDDQLVTFTIRVIDELSGFYSSSFTIRSSTGRQARSGTIWPSHRISGDANDGIYKYNLKIVQYTESVTWHVTYLSVHDRVWNDIRLSESGLQVLGFPTELNVVSAPDDITVPEVVDFSFAPLAIDTSAGPQYVTFTLHATDDLSSFYSSSFQIRSPSGTQGRSATFWPQHLIAGDEMDGVYQYTITIPQYSEIGLWYVSYLSIADDVWNQKIYRTNDLINMGVPPLQVLDSPPNFPPVITSITGSLDPVAVGADYEMTGIFTDPDEGDTHTATWDWGDGTTSEGTVNQMDDTVTDSHVYDEPGVYTITLTVVDSSDESDTAICSQFSVIYDPSTGFVTGGGWIYSPEGAYLLNPELSGKANFGFVAKYKKGATVPTGNTEFQFHAGDLNFNSDTYDWLIIAGARGKFKGSGTINGEGSYKFMLTAVDGAINGGGGVDKFRLKIWEEDGVTGEEILIYDNMMGAEDDVELDETTEIGGGSIKIHK